MSAHSRLAIRATVALAVLALVAGGAAVRSPGWQATPEQAAASPAVVVAANVTIELCADEGTLALPGTSVPIWGFSQDTGAGCGPASLPGPLLDVAVGDQVTVNLRNYLDEPVSMVFPGQPLAPDSAGAPPNDGTGLVAALAATPLSGGGVTTASTLSTSFAGDGNDVTYTADAPGSDGDAITIAYVDPGAPDAPLDVTVAGTAIAVSLATDAAGAVSSTATAVVAAVNADADASALVDAALAGGEGGTASYSFTAGTPGTFLYETGTNVAVQSAMGLYGALVVRAATGAYGAGTEYDVERVLVLSEIDPNLNSAPDPNDFDFVGNPNVYTAGYHPTYFLVNGEAYPDTDPIAAGASSRVLLRYANAGLSHYTMTLLGRHQRVIAKDADPTGANAYDAVAETIPAGATLDTIATLTGVPSGARLPLYNRQLNVVNGSAFPGGMMTFIDVS